MNNSENPTAPSSGIALGVYEPAPDAFSHGTAVDQYTEQVGKKPAFAWFSVKWQNNITGAYQEFDPAILEQYRTRGIMPGITWDASKGIGLNKNQPDFSWKTIASGKHDAYITRVAKGVAAYKYPCVLRTLHEMDGNWYPWGFRANGNNDPKDYAIAWRRIVDIFRKEGATNVQFVWVITAGILNNNIFNKYGDILLQTYPGDDYVDWVGLDGYSNLASDGRSLKTIFQPSYQFLLNHTNRPIMFFEVGATENPADPMAKANWIKESFLITIPQEFPEVKVVNWFNSENDKHDKDYAMDTSQNSLNAWKQVVASPLYQATFP
ncbi:MAG: glycosyl hydrolase [Candidatus Gottesmanbacteria bacterium]